jgi:hypothetical protein
MWRRRAIAAFTLSLGPFAPARSWPVHDSVELRLVVRVVDSCKLIPTGLSSTAAQVEGLFAELGVSVRWLESSVHVREADTPEIIVFLRSQFS